MDEVRTFDYDWFGVKIAVLRVMANKTEFKFRTVDQMTAEYSKWVHGVRQQVLGKNYAKDFFTQGRVSLRTQVNILPQGVAELSRRFMPGTHELRITCRENPDMGSGEQIVASGVSPSRGRYGWGVDPILNEESFVVYELTPDSEFRDGFEIIKPTDINQRVYGVYPGRTWSIEDLARAESGDELEKEKFELLKEFGDAMQHTQGVELGVFAQLLSFMEENRDRLKPYGLVSDD